MNYKIRTRLFASIACCVMAGASFAKDSTTSADLSHANPATTLQEFAQGSDASGKTCEDILKTCKTSRGIDCAQQYKICRWER
jgi:hypothetical protein